jgi:AhpD family alkylhydroperoxidase
VSQKTLSAVFVLRPGAASVLNDFYAESNRRRIWSRFNLLFVKEKEMTQRLNVLEVAQGAMKAMYGLEVYLSKCDLEASLLHLLKLRVSQINGCAYCIDMHWKDLKAGGETDQRLYMLDAWRESPFYSERERAALAWAEAVTLITDGHAPDEVFEEARKQFSETELVNLTLAVVAINGWNRLSIAFRTVPGSYQPGVAQKQL